MADSPDTTGLAWKRQEPARSIVRACYEGPLAIRDAGRGFLPQFPRESDEAYADRLGTSVFYDVVRRTVEGLTGLIFRKPPKLSEDLPEQLRPMWEDIDLRGTHGDVFCQQAHEEGEVDGWFLIFVDIPTADPALVRSAPDEAARQRPYWALYRARDVLGFREARIGGRMRLTHLRLAERVVEPDGVYGEREVERVREYNLTQAGVVYTVHAKDGEDAGWTIVESGTMTIDEIPVAVGYLGKKLGTMETEQPHLALALENVKHYQLVSDNDNVLHIASVPQLVVKGVDDLAATVGPLNGWLVPEDGDVYYAEVAGNGLEAAERRIQKSEQRMAILGLSMLVGETRGESAETATSKRINKAENDSALARHARASQDAFEEALRLSAKWLGLEMPEEGAARWLELNRDFDNLPLESGWIRDLLDMRRAGDLSRETLWEELQRGEVLGETFDPDAERERLAVETPPGLPGSGMGGTGLSFNIPGLS